MSSGDIVKIHKMIKKNWIVNGAMRVNQRDIIALNSIPVAGLSGTYNVDRFRTISSGISGYTQQLLSPDGPTELRGVNYLRTISSSANTGTLGQMQVVDVSDIDKFKGKAVTFSAWVRSSNPEARLQINFGNGNLFSNPISEVAVWERLVVTGILSANATQVATVVTIKDETSNMVAISDGDYIDVTGVKLELGGFVTDFTYDSYAEDLLVCKAYFQSGKTHLSSLTWAGSNNNKGRQSQAFLVPMRAAPSMTTSQGSVGTYGTAPSGNPISHSATTITSYADTTHLFWTNNHTTNTVWSFYAEWTADAEIY